MQSIYPTKPQIENLIQLLDRGGVVPSSEWTNGSGRFITKKALPPSASRMTIEDALGDDEIRGEVRRNLERLHKRRPQLRRVVIITDLRAARAMVRRAQR